MGKNTLFSADFSSKMPLAYRLRPKNLFFNSFTALSIIESTPRSISSALISIFICGSMPHSICSLLASYMGTDEKRTIQPFGISLDMGKPPPPPDLSPTRMAFGTIFILLINEFVALYDIRLVSTATGLRH